MRTRWLVAILRTQFLQPLSPLMFGIVLTLLWRGRDWPGAQSIRASYYSLARSIGHTRPTRAAQRDEPKPSGALKRAGAQLADMAMVTRTEQFTQQPNGQWHRTPYDWDIWPPSHLGSCPLPLWKHAPLTISRIARQRSVYGPVADMLIVRLALIADTGGHVSMRRRDVRRLTGVTPDAAMRHLRHMAAAECGVLSVSESREHRNGGQTFTVQLAVPPMGMVPGEEQRAHSAELLPARQAAAEERLNADDRRQQARAEQLFLYDALRWVCDALLDDDTETLDHMRAEYPEIYAQAMRDIAPYL